MVCKRTTQHPPPYHITSATIPSTHKTMSDYERLGLMMPWAPNFNRCVSPRYVVKVTGCLQKYLLQKPHRMSVSMANLCTEIPWRLGYSLGVVIWVRFWNHSRFCDPASIHLQWIPIPIGHPAGTSAGLCVKTSPYFCWNVHPKKSLHRIVPSVRHVNLVRNSLQMVLEHFHLSFHPFRTWLYLVLKCNLTVSTGTLILIRLIFYANTQPPLDHVCAWPFIVGFTLICMLTSKSYHRE